MRVNDKIFQLVRSIFSFHVEMFFLLGKPKAGLVIKRLKHKKLKCFEPIERSNENPQGWNMTFYVKTHVVFTVSTYIQGDPLQTVELLHHKKIFNNGQKKSPLLHIDQNMTPFIILEKNFFVPFKKVEFLFAFVAKQSFVEQNGAHFWHISSKIS